MSVIGRIQVAVLSWYPLGIVRSAMVCAIPRVLAKAVPDIPKSVQWVTFTSGWLPQDMLITVSVLSSWLQRSTQSVASWHLIHSGVCSDICGDWSNDASGAVSWFIGLESPPGKGGAQVSSKCFVVLCLT